MQCRTPISRENIAYQNQRYNFPLDIRAFSSFHVNFNALFVASCKSSLTDSGHSYSNPTNKEIKHEIPNKPTKEVSHLHGDNIFSNTAILNKIRAKTETNGAYSSSADHFYRTSPPNDGEQFRQI